MRGPDAAEPPRARDPVAPRGQRDASSAPAPPTRGPSLTRQAAVSSCDRSSNRAAQSRPSAGAGMSRRGLSARKPSPTPHHSPPCADRAAAPTVRARARTARRTLAQISGRRERGPITTRVVPRIMRALAGSRSRRRPPVLDPQAGRRDQRDGSRRRRVENLDRHQRDLRRAVVCSPALQRFRGNTDGPRQVTLPVTPLSTSSDPRRDPLAELPRILHAAPASSQPGYATGQLSCFAVVRASDDGTASLTPARGF